MVTNFTTYHPLNPLVIQSYVAPVNSGLPPLQVIFRKFRTLNAAFNMRGDFILGASDYLEACMDPNPKPDTLMPILSFASGLEGPPVTVAGKVPAVSPNPKPLNPKPQALTLDRKPYTLDPKPQAQNQACDAKTSSNSLQDRTKSSWYIGA